MAGTAAPPHDFVADALHGIWDSVLLGHYRIIAVWTGLGVVILVPALVVRIVYGWRRDSQAYAPSQLWRTMHAILVGMVYPAVLGSILYELLPNLVEIEGRATVLPYLPLIALKFAIIAHYCYDYFYIATRYADNAKPYTFQEFFIDMTIVLLLYLSAGAVNIARQAGLLEISAIFCVLYGAYAVWDALRREPWRITAGDAAFCVVYFLFAMLAKGAAGPGDLAPVVLAALVVMGTSVLAITTGPLQDVAVPHGKEKKPAPAHKKHKGRH
ncbi:MAG TPA: hypothetical protein VNU97_16225 [Rhizomicrobium sp.]|jgi:hypothetical protein|nr:hypothetical protein [Rhizomicrobium sp.]